jgi:hypothetical protein
MDEEYRFPSNIHNYGETISFVDGHAELRRWVAPRTAVLSFCLATRPGIMSSAARITSGCGIEISARMRP